MVNTNKKLFTALAIERRRDIVELLADKGQMSSTEISNEFKITSAAISQHLKVLREAEVLKMEKKAQHRLYALNPDAFEEIEKWAREMKNLWSKRFSELDKALANSPP